MSRAYPSRPIFARWYPRASDGMERGGMAERRQVQLAGLSGRVIEVGAGNGLSFAHYPPEVSGVLAVEPEPHLRQLAEREAAHAPVPIEVTGGVAERLPASDGAFDAATVSLVLCSVRDQRAVLRELYRVVRPGGELRFLEHVRADTPGLRRVQRLVDATVWPLLCGGCHSGRDTLAEVEQVGFAVERLDRFVFPDVRLRLPMSQHVLGTATRP